MEPRIDQTQFGSVTIDGEVFTHDVIIRLGGQVEKRKKKRLFSCFRGSRGRLHTCVSDLIASAGSR
jgi:hypothetical protein